MLLKVFNTDLIVYSWQNCVVCFKRGATVSCNQKIGVTKIGCPNNFHFTCAITHGCLFFKDKVSW